MTVTQDGGDTLIAYEGGFEWERGTLRLLGVDAATVTAGDFVSYREGSEYDDTVTGTGGDDYVSGGDGDDGVGGGAGDDGADGGAGDDVVDGGAGDDDVSGGTGDDTVDGGTGNDEMDGGSGDDDVAGGAGNDVVDGGTGDDDLTGGGGSDDLDGGEGDDWLWGGAGDDDLDGGAGDDVLVVTDAGDTVIDTGGGTDTVEASVNVRLGRGVENLTLGAAPAVAKLAVDGAAPAGRGLIGAGNGLDNAIIGSAGGDRLFGRGGDDRLAGGAGDDRLFGGLGVDRLSGGRGADTFVLADGADRDWIGDFRSAQGDLIEIHSAAARRFGQLTVTEGRGGGALVSWRDGSVTLTGVDPDTLDASDFRFAGAPAFAPGDPRPHDLLWSAPAQAGWDTVLV